MEEVFEQVTENQQQNQVQTKLEAEKQIQALRDSTQTTTQPIQENNKTREIYQSSNALKKCLQKSIKDGIQEYYEFTNRISQLFTVHVISNQDDSTIIKNVSNLLNDKSKSQFSLEPVEGTSNFFTNNPTIPQQN